jgi:IPT/TIG domain
VPTYGALPRRPANPRAPAVSRGPAARLPQAARCSGEDGATARLTFHMPLLILCCLVLGLLWPALAEGRASPRVTGLEANNGPEAGGNTVRIHGTALQSESPVQSVTFAGRPAAGVKVESDTSVVAVAPPGGGEAEVRVTNSRGESSPAAPVDRYAYDPPPAGPWLGLNGNSAQFLGPVDAWVEHGLYYDRSGPVELIAGQTLAQNRGIQASIAAGMIPIIPIEYRAYTNCHYGGQCLPTSAAAIREYVVGFVTTGREILARYPAAPILLEATNEPWGYGSAAQYAAILASLLPAAARAHLPMASIYAGATSGGWIKAMYQARPQLQSEIKGWYVHPYNGERNPAAGIAELPRLQAEMTSGQNNVTVTEIGFCAVDLVNACRTGPAPARDSAEAGAVLTGELRRALPFHRAGWLRALLVYSRSDGGWAMQLRGGALTGQGQAFASFAAANP